MSSRRRKNSSAAEPLTPGAAEVDQFLANWPEVARIDLFLADTNGVLRGKRVRRGALAKLFEDGLCLPGSLFATDIRGNTIERSGLGFESGDEDQLCLPVPGTLVATPWEASGGQALLTMCEQDGSGFFADPRQVLGRVAQRLDALGYTPVVAVELEFYLIDRRLDRKGEPQPPRSLLTGERGRETQVYDIATLEEFAPLLDDIDRFCAVQQVPAHTAVKEYAPGQFEINLQHVADVRQACDHAVMLKRIVKAAAARHGLAATFMAKPYEHGSGSGMHLHLSLLDRQGVNVMASATGSPSRELRWAVGGLRRLMAASIALLAPNANAYRRFRVNQFVPLQASWGINNRTVAVRIPGGPAHSRRIEHRVAGADANPYLVAAAVLVGVHHGITKQIDPGPPNEGNAAADAGPGFPVNWLDAIRAFEESAVMADYLGADFTRVYAACRRAERESFESAVTPQEHALYLRLI